MTEAKIFSDDNSDAIWLETPELHTYAMWDKRNESFKLTLERLKTHETLYLEFQKDKSYISINQQNGVGWQAVDFEFDWDEGEVSQAKRKYHFSDVYYSSPVANNTFDNSFRGVTTTYGRPQDLIYEYKLVENKPIKFEIVEANTIITELYERSRLSEYVLKPFNENITQLCFATDFKKLFNAAGSIIGIENIAIMCDAVLSDDVDLYTAYETYSRLRA